MSNYDFRSLSSYDFEQLVRDLLQKELGLTLESFQTGRDEGIDLRYSSISKGEIVIQCKHYVDSGYNLLFGKLKNEELPKVKKLSPGDYIVATSVALNPKKKRKIFELFQPFCKSTGSIYGKSDLNNLLGKFQDIEKQNYKLWLTSSSVLEKILHNEIYISSEFEVETIKKNLKFYVQNKSYTEAIKFLNEYHVCIIAGIPGIGKTTLAQVLSIEYLWKDYEVIKISQNIRDAFSMFNPMKKQLFYYDDFLGQTSLDDKLIKNEESDLIRFIEIISGLQNTRFVLTTREYILNQAKQTYEKLSTSKIDIYKYTVELEKYTKLNKAKILFNHLYFSKIPYSYINKLINEGIYKKIINHSNYNPRIIEWMTDFTLVEGVTEEDYPRHFLDNLINPNKLWDHAYKNQLSNSSKYLLCVISSFSASIELEKLHLAFNYFQSNIAKKLNHQTSIYDFQRSLKELDGNFISLKKKHNQQFVEFHNPSVRDYLENLMSTDGNLALNLIRFSFFFDQILKIWQLGKEYIGILDLIRKNQDLFINTLIKNIQSHLDDANLDIKFERNCIACINIVHELNKEKINNLISLVLPLLLKRIENKRSDKEFLVTFLIKLKAFKEYDYKKIQGNLFIKIKSYLKEDLDWIRDYRIVIRFLDSFNEQCTDSDLADLKETVIDVIDSEISYLLDDYSPPNFMEIDEFVDNLESVADYLDIDVRDELTWIEELTYEIQNEVDDQENDRWEEEKIREHEIDTEIEEMFMGLL